MPQNAEICVCRFQIYDFLYQYCLCIRYLYPHLPIAKRKIRESETVVCLSIFYRERQIQFCLLTFTINLMLMSPQLLSLVLMLLSTCINKQPIRKRKRERKTNLNTVSHPKRSKRRSLLKMNSCCACLLQRLWHVWVRFDVIQFRNLFVNSLFFFFFFKEKNTRCIHSQGSVL